MKKLLICLALAFALTLVAASPVLAGGPPERISITDGPINFSENFGLHSIAVIGVGSFDAQIVRPNGRATEESWFRVSNFSGALLLDGFPIFNGSVSDVKVMVHNGAQSNQPIFTLNSSEPILLFIPGILPLGYYTLVQFQAFELIFAK